MTTYSYFGKFSFAFLMIPILIGCVCLAWRYKRNVDGMRNRAIKMMLTAVFFSYPFVSQSMFQGFSCRVLDNAGVVGGEFVPERYLDVDYQISCEETAYIGFIVFGTAGVLAYPLGIPSATLLLLFKNGKEIKTNGPARQRYEFLVADYRPEFYYWDCFEMLRKVSITGILMFVSPGSLFQLVIGIILCIGFGFSAAWFQPYVSGTANIFKVGTEVTLLVTMVLAVMLKIDLSAETMPCLPWGDDDTKGACGESFIGAIMFITNTVVPGVTLALGLLGEGFKYEVTFVGEVIGETENPLAGLREMELTDDEDSDTGEKEAEEKKKGKKGKK